MNDSLFPNKWKDHHRLYWNFMGTIRALGLVGLIPGLYQLSKETLDYIGVRHGKR